MLLSWLSFSNAHSVLSTVAIICRVQSCRAKCCVLMETFLDKSFNESCSQQVRTARFPTTSNTTQLWVVPILAWRETVPAMSTFYLVTLRNDGPLTARMIRTQSVSKTSSLSKLGPVLLSIMNCTVWILYNDKRTGIETLFFLLLKRQILQGFSNRNISEFGSGIVFFFLFIVLYVSVLPFSSADGTFPLPFLTFMGAQSSPFLTLAEFLLFLLSVMAVLHLVPCCLCTWGYLFLLLRGAMFWLADIISAAIIDPSVLVCHAFSSSVPAMFPSLIMFSNLLPFADPESCICFASRYA